MASAASQSRCRITHRFQLVSCHLAALYLRICVSTYLYLQLKSRIYISTHVLCLFTHRYCLACFCFAFYVSLSVCRFIDAVYIYNLHLSGSLCDCPLTHTHRQVYIRVYLRIYHFTCTLCLLYPTRQFILMGHVTRYNMQWQQELGKFKTYAQQVLRYILQ